MLSYMINYEDVQTLCNTHLLWWKDLILGCSRTNKTIRSNIRATELAVEATMESVGTPRLVFLLVSVEEKNMEVTTLQC